MSKTPLIFGSDPEAFAAYKKDEQLYTLPPYWFRKVLGVNSYLEPKDVHGKHPVFFEEEEFKLIEDGAAFEMTIQPSHSPRQLWERIQACAEQTNARILSQFSDDCLPVLQFLPTVGFDVNRWARMPEDFVMSTMFGCDPSQDAWNLEKKSTITNASQHPWRYGGGHMHISGSKMIQEEPILAARCLSVTAGIAAVAFTDVPDIEKMRTSVYGIPGNFRVQRYGKKNPFGKEYAIGMEYRTPSNRWCTDWEFAEKVFDWARIGVEILLETNLHQEILEIVAEPAQIAILTSDKEMAVQILDYIQTKI